PAPGPSRGHSRGRPRAGRRPLPGLSLGLLRAPAPEHLLREAVLELPAAGIPARLRPHVSASARGLLGPRHPGPGFPHRTPSCEPRLRLPPLPRRLRLGGEGRLDGPVALSRPALADARGPRRLGTLRDRRALQPNVPPRPQTDRPAARVPRHAGTLRSRRAGP